MDVMDKPLVITMEEDIRHHYLLRRALLLCGDRMELDDNKYNDVFVRGEGIPTQFFF